MRTRLIWSVFSFLTGLVLVSSCQSEAEIKKAQFFANGKSIYAQKCENCHGAKGEGLGQLYPPLSDSTFLKNHQSQLACIIRNGLSQEISINGKKFDNTMPPNKDLTDQELAYILTYVGNSFGNNLGFISTEEVQNSLSSCK